MAAVELTQENFEQEVLKAEGKVLVDFWAPWCGPCRMLSPVVDQVAAAHPELKVGKVNVDEQPELAEQFQVMSIPMLIVFEGGRQGKPHPEGTGRGAALLRQRIDCDGTVWPLVARGSSFHNCIVRLAGASVTHACLFSDAPFI